MSVEIKKMGLKDQMMEQEWLSRDVRISRRLINVPEYFYQQPTPEQEAEFRKDYFILWQRLAEEGNVHIPQTIDTFFGKVEFIQDELHFRDFCNIKYKPEYQEYQDFKDRFVNYESLRKERRETFRRLNRLSEVEANKLRAKTANKPLQLIDLSTGGLLTVPSYK